MTLCAADRCTSGMQRLALELAEAVALTSTGDFAAAESVAQQHAALGAGAAEAQAMGNAVLAHVQLTRGQLSAAAAVLQQSVAVLASGFPPAGLILAAAWWAQAESDLGNSAAAAAALRYADDAYGPQASVLRPEIELGRSWMYAAARQPALARERPLPITGRERPLPMVAAGLTNREIAGRLGVSVRTVDGHLYRTFAKLDIRTRDQLAALVAGGRPGARLSAGPAAKLG